MFDSHNRLFDLARQGRRQPSALSAVAITFVALVVMIVPGTILHRLAMRVFPDHGPAAGPLLEGADIFVNFATHFLPIYFFLWVLLAFWYKRPFSTLGLEKRQPAAYVRRGTWIALVMMGATGLIVAALPQTTVARGTLLTAPLAATGGALLALAGTTIQSSGEELLFRGWLLPSLGVRFGPRIGVAASSILFGLAHGSNQNVTLLGLMNLMLFGLCLALLALSEGGLWSACAWHAIWNWTDSNLFGLPNSGGPPHSALLLSVTPHGPAILTGGAFGPDGGLVETVVLLAGIGVLWLTSRRTETAARARQSTDNCIR